MRTEFFNVARSRQIATFPSWRHGWVLCAFLAGCAAPLPKWEPARDRAHSGGSAAAKPATTAQASQTAPAAQPDTRSGTASPAAQAAPPAPASKVAPLSPSDKADLLRQWVDQQKRLYDVAAPLLLANTALCDSHRRHLLGFTAKTRHSFGEDFLDVAESALGLGDSLQVMGVLPGGGAAQAGLREGDVLLAVEIEPLPTGPRAEQDSAALIASEMRGREAVSLAVLRDGARHRIEIPLTPACAMVVNLGDSDAINSYADGNRILITRGMLEYAKTDQELAYVVAREMAHNILLREPREDMAAAIDRLRTLELAAREELPSAELQPYTPVSDATADKLALYILARAGHDYDNSLAFWKRLATQDPSGIGYDHTQLHPNPNYRFSVMAEVTRVIKTKQRHQLPLDP